MARALPFSSDDLRYIANTVDKLNELLIGENGEIVEGLELVERIQIADPWESQSSPGYAVIHEEGWIGFEFNGGGEK